jgi:Xaa-Pro aminopeptidase
LTATAVLFTLWKMNIPTDPLAPRRADIDSKQAWIARLLADVGCEGLMLLEPANFAWLTGGATPRGLLDLSERPALYLNDAGQRWVVCCNLDAQRLFDEELDGLGFQLKEWPWQWGRDQLLADLSHDRKIACDRPYRECVGVGEALRKRRRVLSAYERSTYLTLGKTVAHALEATGRNLESGETEEEVAGQLAHRLLHHGVEPVALQVAADCRGRAYRRHGATPNAVRKTCVLRATAARDGLFVSAARAMTFGEPDELLRKEFDAVCRLSAAYLAYTRPATPAAEALTAGRKQLLLSGFDQEWRLSPPGGLTGRSPSEGALAQLTEPLEEGWAVGWQATVGAAANWDTALVTADGPQVMTPADDLWPVKRIKIQGMTFDRPDILVRSARD